MLSYVQQFLKIEMKSFALKAKLLFLSVFLFYYHMQFKLYNVKSLISYDFSDNS